MIKYNFYTNFHHFKKFIHTNITLMNLKVTIDSEIENERHIHCSFVYLRVINKVNTALFVAQEFRLLYLFPNWNYNCLHLHWSVFTKYLESSRNSMSKSLRYFYLCFIQRNKNIQHFYEIHFLYSKICLRCLLNISAIIL